MNSYSLKKAAIKNLFRQVNLIYMLQNNFKIILRTLSKQKAFTLIHIIGLTLGLTCCLLIYLFIQHELSFDHFHKNANRIYKVCSIDKNKTGLHYSGGTPYPMAPALRNDMPGLAQVARIHQQGEALAKLSDGKKFKLDNVIYAEPELAKIFDLPVINGDLVQTLTAPNQAAITKTLAEKFYGKLDPIGQIISLDNKIEVTITSLLEDNPSNSSLWGALYVSYESFSSDILGFPIDQWGLSVGGVTFALLSEKEDISTYSNQFPQFVKKYMSDDEAQENSLYFQPLKDFHFEGKYANPLTNKSIQKSYLWIFGSVGAFILIIAIFNFVNLSTVQALKRSKEVGVRKVLGAGKLHLIGQVLGEAVTLSAISGVLAAVLSQLSLPFINQLLDKQISYTLFQNPMIWLFLFGVVLLVGLLSGLYPALSFANFKPTKVLKSRTSTGNKNTLWIRRTLVVGQFVITIALIIGTIIVSKQLNYLKNKDLGFNKEAVISLEMPEKDHFEVLRSQWLKHPQIEQVSFNVGAPTSLNDINTTFYKEGETETESHRIALKTIDHAYFDTYGLQLVTGRWLTKEEEQRATNPAIDTRKRTYSFVVNETLTKKLGYTNPAEILGVTLNTSVMSISAKVVGVVKDFNTSSLHEEITPTLMMNLPQLYYNAGLKIKTENMDETLAHIEKVWTAKFPNALFEHQFLDESIAQLYESESQIFNLFQIFAGIAILIACLGLWGLINFVTQQRTKEIGVRKIIGASIPNIVLMLSKDFIFLIIVAALIASPIAWYAMNEWLQNFAYSTNMAWWVFVMAMLITVIITFLTVGYQSFRAAISNPVESLRAE